MPAVIRKLCPECQDLHVFCLNVVGDVIINGSERYVFKCPTTGKAGILVTGDTYGDVVHACPRGAVVITPE